MHGFWVASLQVWPRWALTVIRFVEKYFTRVKDLKNSGQSLVAALHSRPPLTLTVNTIRDYVSVYITLHTTLRHFTPLRYMSDMYLRRYKVQINLETQRANAPSRGSLAHQNTPEASPALPPPMNRANAILSVPPEFSLFGISIFLQPSPFLPRGGAA